ncbi:hypothetical protein ACW9KT_15450 [Hymenobacter sp. HD11105]
MKVSYSSSTGINLTPETVEDASLLDRQAYALARAQVLTRRYILSDKQTPGLGYDDRLSKRLGIGKVKCYQLITSGELSTRKLGGKHVVAETAVLRFLDPHGFVVVENETSTLLAA